MNRRSRNGTGEVRAELYVRTELPPPAREQASAVETQLATLAERDVLESVDRHDWDKRVPVDACAGSVRDTYLTLTAWADDRGVRLTPFFEIRECYSADNGGFTDWLVVPALCLVVYEDDQVRAVYPHADSDTHTVEDGLQALVGDFAGTAEGVPATAD